MNKAALVFLGLLLFSACAFAQTEDEEVVEVPVGSGEQAEAGEEQPELNAEEQMMQDEAFREKIRDMYVACIVTARQKLNTYGNELVELIQKSAPAEGASDKPQPPAIYQKMLAEHIFTCVMHGMQHPTMPSEIIKSLQEKKFQIADWEIIFMNIDFKKYSEADFSTELNEDEKNILQFVEQFDEAMKKQRQDAGITDEDDDGLPGFGGRQQSYEPKIGSFSLSSMPKGVSALYFLIILGALGAAIYYGYTKTDTNEETPKIKVKKNKQKSQ